jgi:hypothetical protein
LRDIAELKTRISVSARCSIRATSTRSFTAAISLLQVGWRLSFFTKELKFSNPHVDFLSDE